MPAVFGQRGGLTPVTTTSETRDATRKDFCGMSTLESVEQSCDGSSRVMWLKKEDMEAIAACEWAVCIVRSPIEIMGKRGTH